MVGVVLLNWDKIFVFVWYVLLSAFSASTSSIVNCFVARNFLIVVLVILIVFFDVFKFCVKNSV